MTNVTRCTSGVHSVKDMNGYGQLITLIEIGEQHGLSNDCSGKSMSTYTGVDGVGFKSLR